MKRLSIFPLFFVCAATGLASHSLSPALAQTLAEAAPVEATSVEAASNFLDWQMKPPVGATYEMRYFARTRSTTLVPESPRKKSRIVVTQLFHFVADAKVLSLAPNGDSRWRFTYRNFALDSTSLLDGKPLPAAYVAAEKRAVAAYLKTLRGMNFIYTSTARGDMKSVEGLAAMRKQIVASATKNAPELRSEMEALVNQSLSEEMFKNTIGKMGGAVPHYPVRVGESWSYKTSALTALPMPVPVSGQRHLHHIENGVALISDKATLSLQKRNQKLNPTDPVAVDIKATGQQNDTMRVDAATGNVLEWNSFQRLSATFTGQEPGSKTPKRVTVPLWMTTESRAVVMPR